ncbi:MAG: hypothetical protein U0744_06795 [Gemmataceae bacterium]
MHWILMLCLCSPLAPREVSGSAPCEREAYIRHPLADRDCGFEGEITAGKIDTIAGSGVKGFEGDGGTGVQAKLNQPFHVEADNKGHLYIAEADNHCIRKLNLKTRVLTTVAGTGKKGYTGDGGPATKATFNEPYAVVVDANDNLFVVDRLNAVVRKIDAKTGNISTVAGNSTKGFSGDGGPGAKAQLREPNDCCFDGKGGLLIADVGDWRVRRLDLETGTITTFAGIGRPNAKGKPARSEIGDGGPATKAILVGARAVASDGKGTVYICEREGSSIRKVDPSGNITTIAGNGAWGEKGDGGDAAKAEFKGPKGIRIDRAGNLFIVDTENHSIRRIDAKTHIVTTVAGGRKGEGGDGGLATDAGMDRPHGCIVDADGYLYVADSNNHRVRRIKLP